MLEWIKQLLGRRANASADTPEEHLGEAWEARQRARRTQEQPPDEQAAPNYGRLEIAVSNEDISERRTKRKERRAGEDRRRAKDRRSQDVSVKQERRRSLWDRRKQYGERRFARDRRGKEDARGKRELSQIYAADGTLLRSVREETQPLAFTSGISATGPQGEEIYGPGDEILAYANPKDAAGCYRLELTGKGITLALDAPDGNACLIRGQEAYPLAIPCAMREDERLVLILHAGTTIRISPASHGALSLNAPPSARGLSEAMRYPLPVATVLARGFGGDIDMPGPQRLRFGGVVIDFDLAQLVELQGESGARVRVSGPAGLANFQRHRAGIKGAS